MARTLNKKGLRRDLNFTDIPNPDLALDNLLDGLVQEAGESFTGKDLDAIKDISSSTITNEDFLNVTAAAVRETTDTSSLEIYDPVIKLKNRFDIAEFTTGVPQFFGGDGLTARYYNDEYIDSNAVDVENIFTTPTDGEVYEEIFWENGLFNFETKINPNLDNIYGGAEWTGYFKPDVSGIWSLRVRSTAFYTIEFDDGAGGYELIGRKSQLEYTFPVESASAGATTIKLQTDTNLRFLLTNDTLISNTISQFEDPLTSGYDKTPVTITSIDRINNEIDISAPLDENLSAGESITFRFSFGDIGGTSSFPSRVLREYQSYNIRYRFWFPDEEFSDETDIREVRFYANSPGRDDNTTYLNYKYLQSENYNINPTPGTTAYGNFKGFYDNRVSAGGGTVGGTGDYDDYESILSLDTINIDYEPPKSYTAAAGDDNISANIQNGLDYIPFSITDGIEVGNYVIGQNLALGTRVDEINYNNAVLLNQNATGTSSSSQIFFVNHRGLSALETGASWSSGGTTISNLTTDFTNLVEIGDVILCYGSPQYNLVTAKTATSVTVSKSFTEDSGGTGSYFDTVLAYKPSGVINTSLDSFCVNVYSAKTVSASAGGTNTLTVDDNTNLANGQVVQYGNRIPAGTTVTNIASSGADYIITLSNNLTDQINSDQIITFAPAGTTESKEICFPQEDIAFPFVSTSDGMETTTTRPDIVINPSSGPGELKFVGLSANLSSAPETASISDTYNRIVLIEDATGTPYKILATTI